MERTNPKDQLPVPTYQLATPPYYEEDEIDLYELWITLKKRSKLIVLITLISILGMLGYIILASPRYKTNFLLEVKIVPSFQVKKILDNIERLINNKQYSTLLQYLTINDIKAIKNIKTSIPRGKNNFISVELETSTPDKIRSLEKKLINYLNSIPIIQKEINSRKELLEATISILQEEVKNFQYLQKQINHNPNFIANSNLQIDPSQIILAIQRNKERIIQAQIELKKTKAVVLAVEGIIPKKPNSPRVKLLLAVGAISGLFFSIFLAFFLEWLEQARKRFEKNSKNN